MPADPSEFSREEREAWDRYAAGLLVDPEAAPAIKLAEVADDMLDERRARFGPRPDEHPADSRAALERDALLAAVYDEFAEALQDDIRAWRVPGSATKRTLGILVAHGLAERDGERYRLVARKEGGE